MKINKKLTLLSVAALMGGAPLFTTNALVTNTYAVQAADTAVKKTVMHAAIAYNKDGNPTKLKYIPYGTITVEPIPVTINNSLFYKISSQDPAFKASGLSEGYVKVTNIDGVQRKLTHNAYIYRTSTGRTSYTGKGGVQNNGAWKLYKGQTVTTYGGSYKFRNGKRYYRVGGPRKQYIKVGNLGSVIKSNTNVSNNSNSGSSSTANKPTNAEETTITVTFPQSRLVIQTDTGYKGTAHYLPVGTKYVADRLEFNQLSERTNTSDPNYYHIKGTNEWINAAYVKADKKLPVHNYFFENFSYITFPQNTDVYNANGTLQDHNGQKISKQKGHIKVDKLVYIWVPSENKAELFYHLAETSLYASESATSKGSTIDVGKDAYVKASDVKFIEQSKKLTPINTAEEAEATYKATNNKL